MTKLLVILNNYQGKHKQFVNTLILVMKHYIYVAKCRENKPTFMEFLQMLRETHKIEKITAYHNDKTRIYYKKWRIYLDY